MAQNIFLTAAMASASLMICAASPPVASHSAAPSSERSTLTVGHEQTPSVPPGAATHHWRRAYLLPFAPKDSRSLRQRCVDQEIAKEGGSPSGLALAAIDLKCSQR